MQRFYFYTSKQEIMSKNININLMFKRLISIKYYTEGNGYLINEINQLQELNIKLFIKLQ